MKGCQKYPEEKDKINDLSVINPIELYGTLDTLMAGKTRELKWQQLKVMRNISKKLKVLKSKGTSKNLGKRIMTNCLDTTWKTMTQALSKIKWVAEESDCLVSSF